jgi:superfamily I DNA/RNA helicase
MASANEAVFASAGSGKTSYLLEHALSDPTKRVLLVTYTNENLREIDSRLWEAHKGQPTNVETMTLFEFLLRECVKPYQTLKAEIAQIRSVNFVTDNPPFSARSDFVRYYLDSANNIYSDAVSDLAWVLNSESGGKVIKRLEAIYDKLLIDELQDLAGWDLEFLILLLQSSIQVVMVGDLRQAVYSTNRSNKNSQFRGAKLQNWIDGRVTAGECAKIEHTHSYRCIQSICDFADSVYPKFPATNSKNTQSTDHDGVFLVHESDVDVYRESFKPQELRWDRRNKKAGLSAKNFGEVKGLAFPRVLIFPTAPILRFVEDGTTLQEVSAAKFYVAVTRARQSVAIVTNKTATKSSLSYWTPTATTSA